MTIAWKHDVEEAGFASAGRTPWAASPTAYLRLNFSNSECEIAEA
jgi:hypothetical protein